LVTKYICLSKPVPDVRWGSINIPEVGLRRATS